MELKRSQTYPFVASTFQPIKKLIFNYFSPKMEPLHQRRRLLNRCVEWKPPWPFPFLGNSLRSAASKPTLFILEPRWSFAWAASKSTLCLRRQRKAEVGFEPTTYGLWFHRSNLWTILPFIFYQVRQISCWSISRIGFLPFSLAYYFPAFYLLWFHEFFHGPPFPFAFF